MINWRLLGIINYTCYIWIYQHYALVSQSWFKDDGKSCKRNSIHLAGNIHQWESVYEWSISNLAMKMVINGYHMPAFLFILIGFVHICFHNIAYLKIFTVNRFKYHISMIGLFFPRAREFMISMLYQDRLQIPNRIPVPSFPDVPQDPNTDFAWEQRREHGRRLVGRFWTLRWRFDGGCYNYYSNGYNYL